MGRRVAVADLRPDAGLARRPVEHAHVRLARCCTRRSVGYYDLQNTRISKNRDIFNSTLGIHNPLEASIGGLAALMPTIDINTQRNSGGIGNAWDFWDIQRVWSASDRWSLATSRHTLQAGVEYRRIALDGEYMARTNGDLDYDNWVFFFTGHGAVGRRIGSRSGRHAATTSSGAGRRRVRAGRLAHRRWPHGERRPAL